MPPLPTIKEPATFARITHAYVWHVAPLYRYQNGTFDVRHVIHIYTHVYSRVEIWFLFNEFAIIANVRFNCKKYVNPYLKLIRITNMIQNLIHSQKLR